MARARVRLDRQGIRTVLSSYPGIRRMVAQAGDQVATAISSQGLEAQSPGQSSGVNISGDVDVRTSRAFDNRPVAVVAITHPAGMAMQAKYGVMTRAAQTLGGGADWNPRNQ